MYVFSEKLSEGSGCSLNSTPCHAEGRAYFVQGERKWKSESTETMIIVDMHVVIDFYLALYCPPGCNVSV